MIKKPALLSLSAPLLLAVLSVLNSYSQRQLTISLGMVLRPILVSVLAVLILMLFLGVLIKNWGRVSTVVSSLIIAFYSYDFIGSRLAVVDLQFVREKSDQISICAAVLFVFVIVVWSKKVEEKLNVFNLLFVFLLAIAIFASGMSIYDGQREKRITEDGYEQAGEEMVDSLGFSTSASKPDIYYIVLDGHIRSDILSKYFGAENSEFTSFLRDSGFFIADKSNANYSQTVLSIGSELNFKYLQDMIPNLVGTDSVDRSAIIDNYIYRNDASAILKNLGYQINYFNSYVWGTDYFDYDKFYARPEELTTIERAILNGSIAKALFNKSLVSGTSFYAKSHAERVDYTLEHLSDVATEAEPTFTFAHIICPHPPFVFDESGEVNPGEIVSFGDGEQYDNYVQNYSKQLAYIDKKIEATVGEILEKSSSPPVIIIQGDHGAMSTFDWQDENQGRRTTENYIERMGNLSAIYLPDTYKSEFKEDMTNVNTFRMIFRSIFGANLPDLEDDIYFSEWNLPYKFVDVTSEVR